MSEATKTVRIVALLTPYKSKFYQWVREFGRDDEQYVFVSKLHDIDGYYFAAIQKGFMYFRVDQDVVDAVKTRIKP